MPQGVNETYAETKARQKQNSLNEQLQKFRKTGVVTKGIARAGLGVQAQDYVVRTDDSPSSIARSLLGANASESQVMALAQSILAANGGTFRPVVAGETLTIPGLSVPRDAAPSRYFMNNAGSPTTPTSGTTTSPASGTPGQVAPISGVTATTGALAGMAAPSPLGMPRVNYQPPTQGMPRVNFQAPNIQGALAGAAANLNTQTSLSRALQNRESTVASLNGQSAPTYSNQPSISAGPRNRLNVGAKFNDNPVLGQVERQIIRNTELAIQTAIEGGNSTGLPPIITDFSHQALGLGQGQDPYIQNGMVWVLDPVFVNASSILGAGMGAGSGSFRVYNAPGVSRVGVGKMGRPLRGGSGNTGSRAFVPRSVGGSSGGGFRPVDWSIGFGS